MRRNVLDYILVRFEFERCMFCAIKSSKFVDFCINRQHVWNFLWAIAMFVLSCTVLEIAQVFS